MSGGFKPQSALVDLTFAGKQTQNKFRNILKYYFVDFTKAFDNIGELRLLLQQLFCRFFRSRKFSNSLRFLCDRLVCLVMSELQTISVECIGVA